MTSAHSRLLHRLHWLLPAWLVLLSLCSLRAQTSPFRKEWTLTAANASSAYTHFGFPPSDPLPSLASTLNFSFTAAASPPCAFQLCARPLIAAPDDYTQWPLNCGPRQQRAINLYNLSQTQPGIASTGQLYLPPGPAYVSVWSGVLGGGVGQCGFRLVVTGDACGVVGGYGGGCGFPLLLNRTVNSTLATVGVGGSYTFAVRPTATGRSQLRINITTAQPYALTAYVREAEPPYLTASPTVAPPYSVFDYNVSSYAGSTLWVNLTNPAARLPYTAASTYRYFITLTPNTSTTTTATPATIALNETLCATGLGPSCGVLPDLYALFGPISKTYAGKDFSAGLLYAMLEVSDSDQLSVALGVVETEGHSAPCMLLRLGALPSSTEYDVRVCPTAASPSVVFYRSQDTLLHDVPWFLALWYQNGQVDGGGNAALAVWTDADCPDSCSGHGVCGDDHRCVCDSDYTLYNCGAIYQPETTLPQAARALIPILAILGGLALGCGLCWYFKRGSDSHWEMRARLAGYRPAGSGAADGDGGGGGGSGSGGGGGGGGWRGAGGRGGFGPASGGGGAGGGGAAAPAAPAARPSQGFGPRGNIHRL